MRSIRISLLSWLIALQMLALVLLVASTYAHTLARMNELLDAELRQIALTAMLHFDEEAPASQAHGLDRAHPPDLKLVTQVWTADGRRIHGSQADPGIWFTPEEGYTTRSRGGNRWRVFTVRSEKGLLYQAAQNIEDRKAVALDIAFKMVIPSVVIVLAIAALLTWALHRSLLPLASTSLEVGRRSATSLKAIDAAGLPSEVHPLITSINALMNRLDRALAAQRQFTADAAHELRTPLTALRLQLRMLASATDEAERSAAMDDMRAGLERATRQVEQLLALSRLDPEATSRRDEPVDFAALVRSVVSEFSPRAQALGIDLGAAVAETDATVRGDPDQLRVLLNNLVDNALRYTPSGGRVDVRLIAEPGVDAIVLEVLDDGPGIAPEERPRVFDRFYRAASSQTETETIAGTGLGLAIVKSIAERQGARITLENGLHDGRGPGLGVRVAFPTTAAG